ncbi:MAG: glycoside hydrolase family 127 protein [Clostridiaceae bacterium]|nr:glycoside hydrolase family 127 protein [Clostridiaceae bacterium]
MKKLLRHLIVPLNAVKINDSYWSKYIKLIHDEVIPYQWEVLNDRLPDVEPSHAIKNFKIAAGLEEGEFYGYVFQDTDLAKWLEAVAYRLDTHPDPELERLADEAIELVEKAQQPDGYLNTYYTIKEPGKRWTNLRECHELYTAGHMMEAAVAYYKATGKRKLLDVMCRFADHIDSVFGDQEGKIKGYDGHQEIELALVKMYEVTGEERYLKLSKFFLDERGKKPYFFEIEYEKRGKTDHFPDFLMHNPMYNQSHIPVREQTTAEGHAVRAVYMLTSMADVAALTNDAELMKACQIMWDNIVSRRVYITGGIGSMAHGESFSFDYDLPNDTMYTETCASIGLIFFAQRMLRIKPESRYADEMERALYNNVLAGMAQDGRSFFYVNPLEVLPEACEKNANYKHVKPVRQKWYACACCPPNVARLLASLGQYIYTVDEDTIYTHLYIGNKTDFKMAGKRVILEQKTNYPWDGNVTFEVTSEDNKETTIALRIPGWCKNYSISINDSRTETEVKDGYAILKRAWGMKDVIELKMEMTAELISTNPAVRQNAGKLAIQRGPIVYCIEEVDNGKNLFAISINPKTKLVEEYDKNLFGGAVVVKANGFRLDQKGWGEKLYDATMVKSYPFEIKAVPYYMWGNRTPGEMIVWIRQHFYH